MVTKSNLTDEQVEAEIARLSQSPEVKLARLEERIRLRRRQRLYMLRMYEKKGRELMNAGITEELLRSTGREELETEAEGILYQGQRIPLYTEEELTEKLKQVPSVGELREKQEDI